MVKIKKIEFKINPKGKWKSTKMIEKHGLFSYPILMTIIIDEKDNKIEVPLSYNNIAEMVKQQIYLERFVDDNFFRIPYSYKVKDGLNFVMMNAYAEDPKFIKEWAERIKDDS